MLNILKNYSEKTSILDDFNFYENREKLLKAKRSSKPAIQTDVFEKADSLVSFSSLSIYINLQQVVQLWILHFTDFSDLKAHLIKKNCYEI